MICKIVLSNFMAHAHTELHLAEGLTVLVGPNNIGKSTIAVALKILARNTNSNFVLQHDQKECSISVETSEGHSIEWIKRKSPSYVINGQTKDRLGRGGTPPELDETLRLAPIEFEDKDFEPHFGDQKSPIFLLNRSPSQIAQFFSTTSDAERLVAMQRLHQRKRSEAQAQAKLLAEQNESIQKSIDVLVDVPILEQQLGGLERDGESLYQFEQEIAQLEAHVQRIAGLMMDQRMEAHRIACLQDLAVVPTQHPTEYLASIVASGHASSINQACFSETQNVLVDIGPVPTVEDIAPLAKATLQIEHLDRDVAFWSDCFQLQSELGTPPCPDSRMAELEERINVMVETARDFEKYNLLVRLLGPLSPAEPATTIEPLADIIKRCSEMQMHLSDTSSTLEQVRRTIEQLDSEASAWLETDPVCSTCGAKITSDSIRFSSHEHEEAR
jgi:exonuclease SbcC